MSPKKHLLLALALPLAAACGSNTSSTDQLQASVPDSTALTLEATGAASEDASLVSDGSAAAALRIGPASSADTASGLEFLPAIRTAIQDLNQGVKQFFDPIGQIIATQGTQIAVGSAETFGPQDKDGVTYLLTVKRFAPNRYAWKLEGKTTGAAADVAYTLLAVGTVFHADTDMAHRGRGQIGIDLDAFKVVKPGFMGQGKLYGAYSNYDSTDPSGVAGDAKTLVYVLQNFSSDTTAHAPVSAAFAGFKSRAGVRSVRVLYYGDLPEFVGNPDHAELLLGRARFNPGVGGRADALVTGGDVPNGELIYGAECWDANENLTWKKVWVCTAPNACTVSSETGSITACAVDLRDATAQAPASDQDLTPEAGAPDPSVTAATVMPSFDNP
ncbi:MAG TPA: hypothetical protein VEJ89_18240 [Myxococcaceae bacterium]|jgi:hypothetical protein|nr:hypothetical protein [Myxococcaceae bacterium]